MAKSLEETKGYRLGRLRALEIKAKIKNKLKGEAVDKYKYFLLSELQRYSFRKRKKHEETHEGCKSWLEEVEDIDFSNLPNPEQYASLVMAIMDWRYNKEDAQRFYKGFIRNF